MISFTAFTDELEKIAGHGVELAGLATLAAPSVAELAGKRVSEKKKAVAETAGLGILAAPSIKHYGSMALNKLRR